VVDNVDYNGLKLLIKERTTNIKTAPVTIPGQGPSSDAWTQLENELFEILWQQHERVSLFIKSKHGEITRRLDQLERQFNHLTQQLPSDTNNSSLVRRSRRYARFVQDTESISEDVQSLSQFANTQRLAFKKILKKYRRWTGSVKLQLRVNNEILSQPTSFLRPNLNSFLERLSKMTSELNSMIVPRHTHFAENNIARDGVSATSQQSSAARLHKEAVGKSSLGFDAAFWSVPLGHTAGRATYWIHPDNIFEAEVLILRHAKHCESKSSTSSNSQGRTHSVMFDNLQRYVNEQGATTVAQMEDMEGSFASKMALNILWAEEADAVVIASDLSPVKTKDNTHRRISSVKRTDLTSCLVPDTSASGNPHREGDRRPSRKGATELREFMAQHRDVKPLAEIHSTRERFAGINNAKDVGVWAVLDQDITMSPPDITSIGVGRKASFSSDYSIESPEGRAFPYTVLQVRWESSRVPEIVRAFDNTHLAQRVRGFTLEMEAIYSICSPEGMPRPLWQPLLGQDIRKVPSLKSRRSTRRTKSGSSSLEEPLPQTSANSSDDGPSDSVFSTTQAQSSATSDMDSRVIVTVPESPSSLGSPDSPRLAFGEQKPLRQKKNVRLLSPAKPPVVSRYWNEFDDSSEFGEDSSYAIFVTPDESSNFPGTETVSKAFSVLLEGASKGKRYILSWLPAPPRRSKEREQEPLLANQRATQNLEDSSDPEAATTTMNRSLRRDGAIPKGPSFRSGNTLRQRKSRDSRETLIFRIYLGAFVLSYIMLVLSAILKGTGRRKARIEVDAGVIVGVVIALFCGIGGVGLMISRKERLSVLHRMAVVLAFFVVCAGSGYLLALVGSVDL
jgi:SPX domain protein involved in polyphosphate accumulation